MHASILALALLAPGQGRDYDFDFDQERIQYSRVRDRGFDRRGGYGGGGYAAPYGANGFSAQFQGPRGGYADVQGGFGRSGYSVAPRDPLAGQFEIDARFRREPRGRFPLLRFLLCGPEIEPRFRGTVDVRRLR